MDPAAEHGSAVVVVSDDPHFVSLVRAVLAPQDLEVHRSHAWRDSSALVRGQRPAVLVLDLGVYQLERGWELLDALGKDPLTRTIPVVVCAAASWLLDEHGDLLARAGTYVWHEPYDPQALLDTIQMARSGRPSTARNSQSGVNADGRPAAPSGPMGVRR